MQLSIVIPIYNGGLKIKRLLDSLKKQVMKDIEVIVIDDGSSDNSCDIVSEYSFCQLFKKDNGGVSSARNLGMSKAQGEYIVFCDQDDVISEEYVSIILRLIKSKKDFYITSKTYHFPHHKAIEFKYRDEILDNHFIIQQKLFANKDQMFSTIWNCIYKKEIIYDNNIRFEERLKLGSEDSLFNIDYVKNIHNMIISSEVYYNYYIYEIGNTITKVNKFYQRDFICFIEHLLPAENEVEDLVYDYIYRCGLHSYIKALKGSEYYSIRKRMYIANQIADITSFQMGCHVRKNLTIKNIYHDVLKKILLSSNDFLVWTGFEFNRIVIRLFGKVNF